MARTCARYGALTSGAALGGVDAAGAAVCASSILLEAAADLQMDAFQVCSRGKMRRSDLIFPWCGRPSSPP